MAKLNGVKTLDMVNGEITKISYDGAEYAKVADRAEKDDLLLSEFDELDIDEGAFYACHSAYRHGIHLYDNNGDFRDRNHGEFKVFRKISASTSPTIEKRVDDLESRVTAIEGVKAETIEFEGAQYRKVERDAREGDVVILRDNPAWYITDNKPYKVEKGVRFTDEDWDSISVYTSGSRTRETVDVYESIAESKPKYEPEVGDIVVVIDNTSCHGNKIGDIGKVGEETPLGDGGVCVYVPNGPTYAIRTKPADIRPATAEEIAQYENALADAEIAEKWAKLGRSVNEYKKGDFVRIIKATIGKNNGEYGTVEDAGDESIGVRLGNGDYRGVYFNEGNSAQLIAPAESVLTHN